MLVVGGGDGKEMSLFVHIQNTEPFKKGKKNIYLLGHVFKIGE